MWNLDYSLYIGTYRHILSSLFCWFNHVKHPNCLFSRCSVLQLNSYPSIVTISPATSLPIDWVTYLDKCSSATMACCNDWLWFIAWYITGNKKIINMTRHPKANKKSIRRNPLDDWVNSLHACFIFLNFKLSFSKAECYFESIILKNNLKTPGIW